MTDTPNYINHVALVLDASSSMTENRKDLGLPAMTVRVRPEHNPEFDVYVQSTSVNRRLVPGTELLLIP